jgi:hypothetical protein
MRFTGQASRSMKFAIVWAADKENKFFLDLEEYLRQLAIRVTCPSFGNASVLAMYILPACSTHRTRTQKFIWGKANPGYNLLEGFMRI